MKGIRARAWRGLALLILVVLTALSCSGEDPGPPGSGEAGLVEHPDPVAPPAQPRAFALPAEPIVAGTKAGYLPGAGEVTPDGAYAYSLAIEVPPGRGLQPGLSIAYSSRGGNGHLGVGFSLGGLSSITRCPRTMASDGVVDGIDDDSSDVFCLDGVRLVAVRGAYGTDGTEYRTEEESFTKVVSHGSPRPTSFRVWRKDGRIRDYAGVGTLEWRMTEEADRSGNQVTYSYEDLSGAGDATEIVLTRIEYLNQRIELGYDRSRRDPALFYAAGVKRTHVLLLRSIAAYGPDPSEVALLWRYDLGYETSPDTGRSRLTEVKRCGGLGGCLMARRFTWSSRRGDWFREAYREEHARFAGAHDPMVLDVDGDGKDEVLFATTDPASPAVLLRSPAAGQPPLSERVAPAPGALGATTAPFAPFNGVVLGYAKPVDAGGDGTSELFAYNDRTRRYELFRWTDRGFEPTGMTVPMSPDLTRWSPTGLGAVEPFHFVDVDGDQLADLVKLVDNAVDGSYDPRWIVRRNQAGGGFGFAYDTGLALGAVDSLAFSSVALDARGDGRGGLWPKGARQLMYPDDAGGFRLEDVPVAPYVHVVRMPDVETIAYTPLEGLMADLNGDGLRDRLLYQVYRPDYGTFPLMTVAWNTGKGFVECDGGDDGRPGYVPPYPASFQAVDVDNDGREDLVVSRNDPPEIAVSQAVASPYNGRGLGVKSTTIAVPGARIMALRTGDFDGDGLVDLMYFGQRCAGDGSGESATSACGTGTKVGSVHVLLQQSTVVDVVTAVADEGGAVAREQVDYARQWTDTPMPSTCVYPAVCLRRGIPVVRRQVFPQSPSRKRELDFSYEDPRADRWGRGFLGFGRFRVWEPQLPRETVTTFDNVTRVGTRYPFAHRPESVTVVTPILEDEADGPREKPRRATARVIRRIYDDEARDLNGGRTHAVFPHDSRSSTWEEEVAIAWETTSGGVHVTGIDGPGQPALRTRYGSTRFDDQGALVSEATETVGGVRTTVATTYEHREADWLLGLPRRQVVTSETAGKTSAAVRTTEFAWDAHGRLTEVTREPTGSVDEREWIAYAYDAEGLLRMVTRSAAGVPTRREHLEYDGTAGHVAPSLVWDDLGHATWFAVHPGYGVVVAEMDANGVQTARTHDDLGRPVTEQPDGAAKQTWSYAQRGNGITVGVTDETGAGGAVLLDAWGRSISVEQIGYDGGTSFADTTYDVLGRVVGQTRLRRFARDDKTTHQVYDSLGRPVRTVEPDGATTRYEHSFFETRIWDPRDATSKLVRDLDDRTVQSVSYLGTTALATGYAYGPFDQIEQITDPRLHRTTIGYDARGRRTLLDDPDKGVTRSFYNGLGDLRRTEIGGQVAVYQRDRIGRAYRVTDVDGVTGYVWDTAPHGMGKLAATVSPDGTRTETLYDEHGWPEEMAWTVRGEAFQVRVSHDGFGRIDTVAYPEVPGAPRFTVKHLYGGSGYLQQIKDVTGEGSVPLWFVDSRSDEGALTRGTYGNGVQTVRRYDPVSGRLATQDENNGAFLSSVRYDYHPDGRVKRRSEMVGARREDYAYDALHRLTGWTLTAGRVTKATEYHYDEIGNLTRVLLGGAEQERNQYLDPRPHALSSNLGGSFAYDDRGRLHEGADRTIDYTSFDLPRQITTGAGTTRFDYDAAGVRVRKEGPDGETTISIGGLYERRQTAAGTAHVFLVAGSDGPVAQVVASEPSGTRSLQFLHQDALGSVTLVTDGTGSVLSRPYYEPFGKRIASDGTALTGPVGDLRHGLTGHAYDDDLGLINMRGRIMDPQLKRFLTPDPFVTAPLFGQSYNRYGYALNDPINRVDPTGYEDEHSPGCGGCAPSQDPIVIQIPTGSGPSGPGADTAPTRSSGDPPRPPPIVKSDVDGASPQGAEPHTWKDNAFVQGVSGFVVGFGFGVLPGGGVVEMTATAAGVMDEGTPQARLGKALGEVAGGLVLTGVGASGEAASWALSATGLGAVVGVPAAVVSAEAVVAGAVNISAGVANLTQAMSSGSGGGTAAAAPGRAPGVSGVPHVGSALKADPHHAFPGVVDNFARDATRFEIPTRGPGGEVVRMSELFQVEGSLNGHAGVFEWIVDQGAMTHRRFIPNGTVTGFPNQVPGR